VFRFTHNMHDMHPGSSNVNLG